MSNVPLSPQLPPCVSTPLAGGVKTVHTSVTVLHSQHTCDTHSQVRVVQSCGGSLCPSQPECLSCVPHGKPVYFFH